MLHHPNSSRQGDQIKRCKYIHLVFTFLYNEEEIPSSFEMFFKDLVAWSKMYSGSHFSNHLSSPLDTIQFPFSNRCRCHPHNHLKLLSKHSLLMPHSFEFFDLPPMQNLIRKKTCSHFMQVDQVNNETSLVQSSLLILQNLQMRTQKDIKMQCQYSAIMRAEFFFATDHMQVHILAMRYVGLGLG